MKSIILAILMLLPVSAYAAMLEWSRNSENDMKDYQVYACFTKGCVVTRTPSMLQPGAIPQTPVGVTPTSTLDITGLEGSVAVTARDLSLNESGLSVTAPFDAAAPGVPGAPRFR